MSKQIVAGVASRRQQLRYRRPFKLYGPRTRTLQQFAQLSKLAIRLSVVSNLGTHIPAAIFSSRKAPLWPVGFPATRIG
jgi:hypothetical protein